MRDVNIALREENEELRERLRQMQQEMADARLLLPRSLRLTKSEEVITRHLLTRDLATMRSIILLLSSDRAGDETEEITVRVHISRIRKKLKPYGVVVENVWGRGWRIADRSAAAARIQ